ncbi:hypothetical protein R3P38DRAFT_3347372 [Favolaschia claudopus]|uniref:Uncharacterized protein n=1 Tax=Favolaschia claudopus TaxID=2862362 RepID=A0AAW0D2X4_9AGAR
MMDTIVDSGYESDSGERDIPTLQDFIQFRPVTQVVGRRRGYHGKALNRKGRAICRILCGEGGWSHSDLAFVFRISEASIKRAVENTFYDPADHVEHDKSIAGPDFWGENLPAVVDAQLKAERRAEADKIKNALNVSTSEDPDFVDLTSETISSGSGSISSTPPTTPSQNSSPTGSASSIFSQAVRSPFTPLRTPSRPIPLPKPSPQRSPTTQSASSPSTSSPASTPSNPMLDFLKTNRFNRDLTHHLEFLTIQGFDIQNLHAVATWTPNEIHDGLTRLLMGQGARGVGRKPMTAVELVTFEMALQKFEGNMPPPPPSTLASTPAPTLRALLQNVMNLNLTAHQQLMDTQGFDIPGLTSMAAQKGEELRGLLSRTLLNPQHLVDKEEREMSAVPKVGEEEYLGMSALEVVALEFCLRTGASTMGGR